MACLAKWVRVVRDAPSWHALPLAALVALSACGGDEEVPPNTSGGERNPTCVAGASAGEVQAPQYAYSLQGQTSWFASPIVHDLDGDGSRELIAAYYSVFVFDSAGELLAELEGGDGRVYAPHVVADIDGDGITEIVYGCGHEVYAYEWRGGAPQLKAGWPADASGGVGDPEVRGMAAGDLDLDGTIEIAVTTQPAGVSWPAWPRYNALTGPGGDADRNGYGHHGFGCYGRGGRFQLALAA